VCRLAATGIGGGLRPLLLLGRLLLLRRLAAAAAAALAATGAARAVPAAKRRAIVSQSMALSSIVLLSPPFGFRTHNQNWHSIKTSPQEVFWIKESLNTMCMPGQR